VKASAAIGDRSVSGRVHSRYSRRLADAAIGGRQVEILLAVRRFFCPASGCSAVAADFIDRVLSGTSAAAGPPRPAARHYLTGRVTAR
jgi:transposase